MADGSPRRPVDRVPRPVTEAEPALRPGGPRAGWPPIAGRPGFGGRLSGAIDINAEECTVAVKLRLVRIGKKKQPTYRLVAADSRSPRNGRFIEIVGTYAPRGKSLAEPDAVIEIDNAKAVKWLSQGAQPDRAGREAAQEVGRAGRVRHGQGGQVTDEMAVDSADDVNTIDDVRRPRGRRQPATGCRRHAAGGGDLPGQLHRHRSRVGGRSTPRSAGTPCGSASTWPPTTWAGSSAGEAGWPRPSAPWWPRPGPGRGPHQRGHRRRLELTDVVRPDARPTSRPVAAGGPSGAGRPDYPACCSRSATS